MTDKATDVPVTKADRDAAATLIEAWNGHRVLLGHHRLIRDGEADEMELVQAFARHRTAHSGEPSGDYVEAFDILVDVQSALVLTVEHSPGTSVASFVSSSTEYDRLNKFLHARQHEDPRAHSGEAKKCGGALGSSGMVCALPEGHDGICVAKARDDSEHGNCGAPPPHSGEGRETAWLIERRSNPPEWATSQSPHGISDFSSEIHRSQMFQTRKDAMTAMRDMRHVLPEERGQFFVSHHVFIDRENGSLPEKSGEGRSNGAGEVTQAPLPVTAEDIAGIFDALEQWMRDNGDLPAGACGWREQMAEDPKSQATAEAFIRIVREHDNQSHSLPGDVASEADIALLGARMVLEGKATNATGALAKSDWGPSRAHIEGMRNTMREAIEYIDEARAALTPSALSGDAGECETCGGAGEVFGHADDCSNDSCALNGDMDSCNGKVEACHSCSADPEKFERLRSLSDRAAPAPWVVYSEPEVGLFASVFSGTVMQTGFAPVNLDDPANVEFIVEAANFLRAALPSHQGAGEP